MSSSHLPLISIALCTYNGERFIKEQVESLINQTYPNIEIIICDDNSDDQTYHLLQSVYGSNKRIRLYKNHQNLGFVNNFLHTLSLCSGEYIALCDQDDIWLNHKISTLYSNISKNALIYSDSQLINERGDLLNKRLSEIVIPVTQKNTRAFIFNNSIPGHTMMFRKDLLNHLKSISLIFHDWWIAYVANCIGTITYVNECLVYYRQHEKNVTDILKERTRISNLHSKDRIKESQDTINWIKVFLNFEKNTESDRIFLERLIKGYEDRITSYFFSFRLFFVLITNLSLFKIKNKSLLAKLSYVIKESFGLQVKVLFHKMKHSLLSK